MLRKAKKIPLKINPPSKRDIIQQTFENTTETKTRKTKKFFIFGIN